MIYALPEVANRAAKCKQCGQQGGSRERERKEGRKEEEWEKKGEGNGYRCGSCAGRNMQMMDRNRNGLVLSGEEGRGSKGKEERERGRLIYRGE